MLARAGLLLAMLACGSSRSPHMYPPGSDQDDGYGELAQKSARLLTHDGADPVMLALHRPHVHTDPYGGDPYGGADSPDSDDHGDSSDSSDVATTSTPAPSNPAIPAPHSPAPRPARRYRPAAGLTGTVEGTIRWRGAPPPALVTACGTIAQPAPRVSASHMVGGVLVTLAPLATARLLPSFARAASVGGTVVKRGCVLAPALQIVTPLPATVAVHGDPTATKLVATFPSSVEPFDLPPAGRIVLPMHAGVTRLEAADRSLAAAWIVASDTPYYAITDDDGRFRITELAPGTYDLTLWHPPLATVHDGALSYGPPVITHHALRVDLAHVAHLDLALGP